MPAVCMYIPLGDGLKSDYKPTYEDFLQTKKTCAMVRFNDQLSRVKGYEVIEGATVPCIRYYVTLTGHNARNFMIDTPEFVFIEYRDVVSYYRLSNLSPTKNVVELVFKELLYDIKAYGPDKWVG